MKDVRYFQHDANARHDPKIRALINKYGLEGYARFWIIIEMLRESSTYKLEDEEYLWGALADEMQCTIPQVKEFIADCVNIFKLFVQEDRFFYSQALLTRMIKLDNIRLKRSEAGKWDRD